MKIAALSVNDIDEAIRLARRSWAESHFARLPFDEAKLRANLAAMIARPQSYNCALLARREDGVLAGYLAGTVEEYFFSRERVATVAFLFVDPPQRGGLAAVKLILAFRRWALNRGAAELRVGVASGVAVERTGGFLRRLGFTPTGGNYSQWLMGAAAGAAVPAGHRQGQAR